jgi:hypothetical protein
MRGEKGVTVVLDDIVKFSNESGSLVVRQVKVHRLDMGSRVPVAKAGAGHSGYVDCAARRLRLIASPVLR